MRLLILSSGSDAILALPPNFVSIRYINVLTQNSDVKSIDRMNLAIYDATKKERKSPKKSGLRMLSRKMLHFHHLCQLLEPCTFAPESKDC